MKKLLSLLLCFALLCSSLCLTSCDEADNGLPDLADCPIGYKLDVYPKVPFSYKVNDDCIVRIESVTATLTAKNEIKKDDMIEGKWCKYDITFDISGSVNQEFIETKKNLYVQFMLSYQRWGFWEFKATIEADGSLRINETRGINSNDIVYFYGARS